MSKQPEFTKGRTLRFIVVMCFIVALILSVLSSSLKEPQERARELYRSTQLLIAAGFITPEGVLKSTGKSASSSEILALYRDRVVPILVNDRGDVVSWEEAGMTVNEYVEAHQKIGFAHLPLKLLYEITGSGYVIPINGYGLWGPIYGYIGLESDADTVIWTTWYDQIETPGLGGNIELPSWQEQFAGKVIFRKSASGSTDFKNAPIGIRVVRTTVAEELGSSYAAESAVDGISGATITSIGVTEAYKESLGPYRPFLARVASGK